VTTIPPTATHQKVRRYSKHAVCDSREPRKNDRSRFPLVRHSQEYRLQRRYTTADIYARGDDYRKRHDVDSRHVRRQSDDRRRSETHRVFDINDNQLRDFKMERDRRFSKKDIGIWEPPYCEEASFHADIPEGSVRVMSRY
jgi:hypothetical protein